jgi:hypothetical protein
MRAENVARANTRRRTRSLVGSSVWKYLYLYLYLLKQGHLSRLFNETNYAKHKVLDENHNSKRIGCGRTGLSRLPAKVASKDCALSEEVGLHNIATIHLYFGLKSS